MQAAVAVDVLLREEDMRRPLLDAAMPLVDTLASQAAQASDCLTGETCCCGLASPVHIMHVLPEVTRCDWEHRVSCSHANLLFSLTLSQAKCS